MAARHTVDKLFIAQDAGGRTITPRIVGGAITPTNSESVMLPIQVNDLGQLVTGNVSDPSAVTAPYYTLSKVSGSIVKSSPGILNSIYGFNSGSGQFIQIHNLDEQPLNGAISVLPIWVAAVSNFSVDFGSTGLPLTNGISIFNSSTAGILTSGSEDILFTVIYS